MHSNSQIQIRVNIEHHEKHPDYFDITVPEKARAIILQNVWTTPSVIATEVQRLYPDVLTTQIYYAWKIASQGLWMRDENQMESAIKLLDENAEHVDRFEIEPIEGVTALAWG
jgi:hypothetical protein